MKKFTTEAFQTITAELNKMRGELSRREPLKAKDLLEALKVYGFPVNSVFIAAMVEYKIFLRDETNKYTMPTEPVHYMTYEKAYKSYLQKKKDYRTNPAKKRVTNTVKVTSSNMEDAIQRAITLLKAQGDRFRITEKKVTVEYKEL